MILLEKITIKSVRSLPFFPHNGKLPDFSYKLLHFKISDVLSIFIFPPRIPKQCMENKIILSAILGIEVLIETFVFEY